MHYYIQKQTNQATEHPATTPGDGKMFIDATNDRDFTTVSGDISVAKDKFGFADFTQSTAGDRPALNTGNKEIDFANTTKHLISGLAGYIFSTSDGLSIFGLLKSDIPGTGASHFILDFGAVTLLGYGLGYSKSEVFTYTSTDDGGAADGKVIVDDTGYRRIGFVIEFGVDQQIYVDNVSVNTTAITLTQLTAAEINENPTRIVGFGPVTLGLQSKTEFSATRFFGKQMKCLMVYSNKIEEINRDRLDKFMQILEAR